MDKEKRNEVKQRLKKEFPQFTFSVVRDRCDSVSIAITSWPLDLCLQAYTEKENNRALDQFNTDNNKTAKDRWYYGINQYHTDWYTYKEIFDQMIKIINKDNRDKSDSQTDYFDVWFYLHLSVGKRDKPYALKS